MALNSSLKEAELKKKKTQQKKNVSFSYFKSQSVAELSNWDHASPWPDFFNLVRIPPE